MTDIIQTPFQVEEMIVLMLHEIIDDCFDNEKKNPKTNPDNSAIFEHDKDILKDSPTNDCELFMIPKKRRRLGVNPGAHEQILRLQNTLNYVTQEKDQWRLKCLNLERKIAQIQENEEALEDEISQKCRLIRFYQKKLQEKIQTDAAINKIPYDKPAEYEIEQ